MHPGVGWSHCIIWGWNKIGLMSLSLILWEGQDSGKFSGKFQWVPKALLSPCFYSVCLCPFAQLSSFPHQLGLETCNMALCCDFLPNIFKQSFCFKVDFTESLRQWRDLALKQHSVKLPVSKIEHESPIFQIFWSAHQISRVSQWPHFSRAFLLCLVLFIPLYLSSSKLT